MVFILFLPWNRCGATAGLHKRAPFLRRATRRTLDERREGGNKYDDWRTPAIRAAGSGEPRCEKLRQRGNERSIEETPWQAPSIRASKGRTVVVTGGGQGIGAATVRLSPSRARRSASSTSPRQPSRALAEELAEAGHERHFEKADITDIEALKAAIAAIRRAFGPITVLVNNAAHDQRHKFFEVTPDYFDDRVAVNLKHAFFAAQAIIPDMIAAGRRRHRQSRLLLLADGIGGPHRLCHDEIGRAVG